MSIIDFVTIGIHTLAITQDGYLLTWNLSPQSLSKQITKDFPYLQNDFQYKILDNPAISILKNHKYVFICGLKQIKIIEITDLLNFIKKYKNRDNKYQLACKTYKQQHGIHTAIIIQNKYQYQQLEMFDQSKQNQLPNQNNNNSSPSTHILIYSTKSGKIFSLHPNFKDTTLICDITSKQIHNNQNNQSHNLNHNVGCIIGWHQCVTSMIVYRDNSLLLVGTSAGRILIVSLVGLKIIENVTMRNNLKLGAVQNLILSTGGHRFYSIHSNCIIEWSMQLQRCLGYYAYTSPYSLLYTQKLCLDSPKILISGGNRFIQIIDVQNPQKRSQVQTNLQSIHIMKQINNKIYCGGNGMIEILQLGVTDLLLFRREQTGYF